MFQNHSWHNLLDGVLIKPCLIKSIDLLGSNLSEYREKYEQRCNTSKNLRRGRM